MSVTPIPTRPAVFSIMSFTREVMTTRGLGASYGVNYGGWSFSFILKKVPPFAGLHLHLQTPTLPGPIRVVSVNSMEVAGRSLAEVETWCDGGTVRLECVDDTSPIYTHLRGRQDASFLPVSTNHRPPTAMHTRSIPPAADVPAQITTFRQQQQQQQQQGQGWQPEEEVFSLNSHTEEVRSGVE